MGSIRRLAAAAVGTLILGGLSWGGGVPSSWFPAPPLPLLVPCEVREVNRACNSSNGLCVQEPGIQNWCKQLCDIDEDSGIVIHVSCKGSNTSGGW